MADDDLPDAPWATSSPDDDLPDAPWATSSPDDSSELGAFARGAAHGAAPAVGGVAAGLMAAGATAPLGPFVSIPTGLAVGMGAGAGLEKGEDWLLDKLGWRDKAQEQADQEQHPNWRMAGEMAPAALTLRPSGSLMQRGVGAAIGGIASGASDLIQNGEIDPKNVLAGAGMGAAFPSANRLGQAAERVGARAGAALGVKGAPAPAAEEVQAPSRDLKLTDDQYTDEPPYPMQRATEASDTSSATELQAAQDMLNKLPAGHPMRRNIEDYIDDFSKAAKQPDGQATPSVSPRVSLGVSEVAAAPSQDPTIAGNETGAPMLDRVASRPSDPARDYRKNKPTPSQPPEQVQDSVALSTDQLHPDVAAALTPGEPSTTFQQRTVTQAPEQAEPPQPPVQTGLPQRPPSQQAPVQAALPTRPPGRTETGLTAAVTPDTVRDKLNAIGFKKALDAFDAMSPEDQAAEAPKFMALTENTRAQRKTEGGVVYRSKADKARKEGSTAAVTQAVDELQPHTLTLDRTPENKAAINEHASDLYERSKELFGDKDPVKAPEGYIPTQPSPAHNLVIRARKIATKNGKASWAALEDYVHALELKGETGQKVDEGIAMSRRPTVEDAQGSALTDGSRQTFEHIPDVAEGKDNSYTEANNALVDYINDLSPADYGTLAEQHDLSTDLDQPADPAELLGNYKQTIADASGQRPGRVELVPGEDVPGGKRTRVTDAAGVDRFAPTQEGGKASEGKSLKGTAAFADLAAKYGGMKAPDRTGRLESEQAAVTNPEIPTTWDAATKALKKFAGDEGGGGPASAFLTNLFKRDPYDPSSQHRSDQVTKMLDYMPSWFKAHSNGRAADKGQLAANSLKAAAMDLPKNDWAQIDQAYQTKSESALPGKLRDASKEVVEPLLAKGNALYKEIYDLDQSQGLRLNLPKPHDGFDNRYFPRQKIDEDVSDRENSNPIVGNTFSSWAPSLQAREYMGLLDQATGNRLVLHAGDDGKFSIAQGGNFRPLTKLPSGFEGKVGDTLPLYSGGKKAVFTVDHAATDEIEAATKGGKGEITYQKNPIVTLSNWVNQLQAAKANIETMQKIKEDPLFLNNTTTDRDEAYKRGYDLTPTKLAQLAEDSHGKQRFMPNNMRWLFDDAHRQGFGGDDANWLRYGGSALARIFMTFGSPIHVANIATNAVIGRGFDNITPQGIRALGVTGVRAFKAVNDAANSKDYGDFLKAGGRPQFLSTLTNDLIPNITRRMGADIASSPSKWDPIAKMWGVSTPDFARAVENFSTKEMWRASDMFSIQRFLENRDFKGMSPEDAAADVHKFIPSYDLNPTVGGSGHVGRFLAQALADPATSLFGRYHMDLLRSFTHPVRSILSPSSTPSERIKGVGQAMTMAALAYVAYPALDKLTQAVSGNPDAEFGRRGMLAVTDAMDKMRKGDSDYTRLATNLFTPSIPLGMATKALANTTWNRKDIVQQMPLNSPRNVAKAVGQGADWAAQGLIAPYGNVAGDLTKGGTIAGTAGKFAAGMVGARLPSDKSRNYTAHQEQINNRAIRAREKNPQGPLEALANRL